MTSRSSLTTSAIALSAVIAVGVAGYMAITGMGFIDALYMTVTTISTVGFREVAPLGPVGQLFTVALIISGVGIVFYSASLVARDLIEGELRRGLGRRRVERQIARMAGHVIVCGFGRMGRSVCRELAAKPVPFVVIDREPEALRHAESEGYLKLDGDASEDDVLRAAGIERARGLVAALPADAGNVYVVLTAREITSRLLIVARAEDERSERKLLHAGANRVVLPYAISGHRMAHALLRPAVLDVIDLATHYRSLELQIEEVPVTPDTFCAGVTLQESGLREDLGLIVIAIKKADDTMQFNPTADTRIAPGDRLVLMGPVDNLREIERRVRS